MTPPRRTARLHALLRLVSLQASWTYERMQGVGIGVATDPLLEPLRDYPERERAARARSVQYFNAHPYLGSVAVGALARAELEGEPGERIGRLRTALSGPLGALGDQLFWAGVVPALMSFALVAIAWGAGPLAVAIAVIVYNVARFAVTAWGLEVGLAHGVRVAHVIAGSWLPRGTAWAGTAAALGVGFALPVVARWFLGDGDYGGRTSAVALTVALAFGLAGLRRRVPAIAFTLFLAGLVLLWRWSSV